MGHPILMGEAHIVVVGCGFGGLAFCRSLRSFKAHITVVDRTNHHLFQPLLYQVAMAGLAGADIAQPIRSVLSHRSNLEVLLEEVKDFDLSGKRVICAQNTLSYDYLVLALGSQTSYFGHPEWAEFAPGLKTLDDAFVIRRNVLQAFEQAENTTDPHEQARLMTIVVVGGGATGVEMAGACAELAHHVLRCDFRRIDPTSAQIILIEASPRILNQFPGDLAEKARHSLEKLGVRVNTSCAVKALEKGTITLSNGEVIRAENIIWTAGVMAHPLTHKLAADLDRSGRIKVAPDLSLPGHPEVFAIGDIAMVHQESGEAVPGVAPAAMQMGRFVARVLDKELQAPAKEAPRPVFHYRNKGNLATVGRSAAIAQFENIKFNGFFAWLAWLLVHLIFLIGFRNKVAVMFSWIYSYLTYKSGARIITNGPKGEK